MTKLRVVFLNIANATANYTNFVGLEVLMNCLLLTANFVKICWYHQTFGME
jgi:hypothetical protein